MVCSGHKGWTKHSSYPKEVCDLMWKTKHAQMKHLTHCKKWQRWVWGLKGFRDDATFIILGIKGWTGITTFQTARMVCAKPQRGKQILHLQKKICKKKATNGKQQGKGGRTGKAVSVWLEMTLKATRRGLGTGELYEQIYFWKLALEV